MVMVESSGNGTDSPYIKSTTLVISSTNCPLVDTAGWASGFSPNIPNTLSLNPNHVKPSVWPAPRENNFLTIQTSSPILIGPRKPLLGTEFSLMGPNCPL